MMSSGPAAEGDAKSKSNFAPAGLRRKKDWSCMMCAMIDGVPSLLKGQSTRRLVALAESGGISFRGLDAASECEYGPWNCLSEYRVIHCVII
jgi:hypothetical protein